MGTRAERPGIRTLTGRLLLWHAVAVLGVLLALGVVVDRVLERSFGDQLTGSLVAEARAVQQALPPGTPPQSRVVRLGRAIGVRITVIRTDGVVLADSEHDPATMVNHRDRPEVRVALGGRVGVSSRSSATIGIPFRYVALPPRDGRLVRVALPMTEVRSRLRTVRVILVVGFGLAALAGLVVLSLIARGLARPLRSLASAVERVGQGDLGTEIPERGTDEVVALAHAVNRMRDEVAMRIAALERERSARDAILSTLEEGVVLFDSDGRVLYRNGAAERLLGQMQTLRGLSPAALQDLVRAVLETAAEDGVRRSREVTVGTRPLTIAATAVRVPGDGWALLVLRDVTEARAVDAVRRDFVANASHELKTPAASLRALAETVATASADDPAAVPRFAGRLEAEAIRLSRVISDLLDLSRLESGTGERSRVRFDQVVAGEIESLRGRAAAAGLSLTLEREPVEVTGSARDLGLLARNLVENALQYTRAGGRVEVGVGLEDSEAVLRVRDTGLGIPTKDQARIFERFYRVDRARSRETGGTGLGLSIVKHVAENHGGTVAVTSRLGEGSTFTVRLPLG